MVVRFFLHFLHNCRSEFLSVLNIIERIIKKKKAKSHKILFQKRAWELLIHKPWHQVRRNADGGLADAGKHESGVQRLKVAQIFTIQYTIQNLHLLYCTLLFHLPSLNYFSMRVCTLLHQLLPKNVEIVCSL